MLRIRLTNTPTNGVFVMKRNLENDGPSEQVHIRYLAIELAENLGNLLGIDWVSIPVVDGGKELTKYNTLLIEILNLEDGRHPPFEKQKEIAKEIYAAAMKLIGDSCDVEVQVGPLLDRTNTACYPTPKK